jgi:hypothetical protein
MSDEINARQNLIDWAKHKDEKLQGLKNGTWSMWNDLGDLGNDAYYGVPAYMAGQTLSTTGSGGTNPYDDGKDAYEKAKVYAEHVGEARQQTPVPGLSPRDSDAKSVWNYFMKFGTKP